MPGMTGVWALAVRGDRVLKRKKGRIKDYGQTELSMAWRTITSGLSMPSLAEMLSDLGQLYSVRERGGVP